MNIPSLRVDGKVAFITGAGSGLGQASAVALAQAGADVALTELPGKEGLAAETVRLVETAGRRALAVSLDVTRLAMIGDAVQQTRKHWPYRHSGQQRRHQRSPLGGGRYRRGLGSRAGRELKGCFLRGSGGRESGDDPAWRRQDYQYRLAKWRHWLLLPGR